MTIVKGWDWTSIKNTFPMTYKHFNPSSIKSLSQAWQFLDEEKIVVIVDLNVGLDEDEWFYKCYDTLREESYSSRPTAMFDDREEATVEALLYALDALEERSIRFFGTPAQLKEYNEKKLNRS